MNSQIIREISVLSFVACSAFSDVRQIGDVTEPISTKFATAHWAPDTLVLLYAQTKHETWDRCVDNLTGVTHFCSTLYKPLMDDLTTTENVQVVVAAAAAAAASGSASHGVDFERWFKRNRRIKSR